MFATIIFLRSINGLITSLHVCTASQLTSLSGHEHQRGGVFGLQLRLLIATVFMVFPLQEVPSEQGLQMMPKGAPEDVVLGLIGLVPCMSCALLSCDFLCFTGGAV